MLSPDSLITRRVQKTRLEAEAFSGPQMKPNHLLWDVQLLTSFCYAGPQQRSPVSISTKAHGDLLCFWQQDWAIIWRGAPHNLRENIQRWAVPESLQPANEEQKEWWYRRFTQRTMLQVRLCSLSHCRLHQPGRGNGISERKNNKCWGSVEQLEDRNGQKYPRWFFHQCINVWMRSDVCTCHCCLMSVTDIINAAKMNVRWGILPFEFRG